MKETPDLVKALEGVSLFSRLRPKYLKAILKTCTMRTFEEGEVLVEQGNSGVGLFIILGGQVRVVKTIGDGTKLEIARNSVGDVIGEMSVLDGASRSASVIACNQVSCLVLSSWGFKSILETHPEVALGVLPVVVQRFRETSNKLIEIGTKNTGAIDPVVETN